MFGAALNVVTTRELLGANYGFVVLPWANNRVQGVEDFDSNPGSGLTDKPGGTISQQLTTTVTVNAIDTKVPAVTVTTADARKMSFKVDNPKNLDGVNVGDGADHVHAGDGNQREVAIPTWLPAQRAKRRGRRSRS